MRTTKETKNKETAMTTIRICKANAVAQNRDVLTAGRVGAKLCFVFDEAWDGLIKTAVFVCGDTQLDVTESAWVDNVCAIPHECFAQEGAELKVGVYGANTDGSIVIPTVYASLGIVRKGADPGNAAGCEPTLPVWQQLEGVLAELSAKSEALEQRLNKLIVSETVAAFDNLLPKADDGTGNVLNGTGYINGKRLSDSDGTTQMTAATMTTTGYIPCAEGDVIRTESISFKIASKNSGIFLYDAEHAKIASLKSLSLSSDGDESICKDYVAFDDGCSFAVAKEGTAYIRFVVMTSTIGENPIITVNEAIEYSETDFLSDSIKVHEGSVYGIEKYEKLEHKVSAIESDSTDAEYPSAKAVADYVSSVLGA